MTENFFKLFLVKHLNIFYGSDCIVKDLSFSLGRGCVLALIGPNGSGKTTLLSTLASMHKTYTGQWGWQHSDQILDLKISDIAYLPQRNTLDKYFPLTVEQVVSMGCWSLGPTTKTFRAHDHIKIKEAIHRVKLSGYSHRPLCVLSGGQFQRMLFARMIVQDAPLLLLDEPFSGVDEETIATLMELILGLAKEGKTIIVSQHNRGHVLKYFPETLLLARHFYRWGKTADVLTPENLAQAYESIEAVSCC